MRRPRLLLALLATGAGCVGRECPRPPLCGPCPDEDGSGDWLVAPAAASREPPARIAAVTATGGLGAGERPRPVGRRSMRLRGARLDEVLRMLADLGRFDLVLAGELANPVSLDLWDVEPFDALAVLAETHGASVRCRGQLVTVSAP